MHYSTVTHKGQVTIPADLRKFLEIKEGDKVFFIKTGDHLVLTIEHKVDLTSLYGCLPKPQKALSIEEMNEIIENKK